MISSSYKEKPRSAKINYYMKLADLEHFEVLFFVNDGIANQHRELGLASPVVVLGEALSPVEVESIAKMGSIWLIANQESIEVKIPREFKR